MDGQEITNPQDMAAAMNSHRAGDTVTLTIFRARKRMDIKVKLNDATDAKAQTDQQA
jgi:S1-C subfamily serine protease